MMKANSSLYHIVKFPLMDPITCVKPETHGAFQVFQCKVFHSHSLKYFQNEIFHNIFTVYSDQYDEGSIKRNL